MNQEELKQRLIELLKECTFGINNHILTDYVLEETLKSVADHLIANGVTIRERGEWIPITERLPEIETRVKRHSYSFDKSVRVLCVCRQKSGKTMVKEGYCEIFNGKPRWAIPGSIDSVTHWMPLPEPPETEKGDEGK